MADVTRRREVGAGMARCSGVQVQTSRSASHYEHSDAESGSSHGYGELVQRVSSGQHEVSDVGEHHEGKWRPWSCELDPDGHGECGEMG